MLLYQVTRTLYIFGGQRNKEHQADLLAVNVDVIENPSAEGLPMVQAVCTAAPTRHAPPTGFTQRATIDPDLNEIYVLSVSIFYLKTRLRQRVTLLSNIFRVLAKKRTNVSLTRSGSSR